MMKKSLGGFEYLYCCLQCSAEEQPDEQEEGSWEPGRPSFHLLHCCKKDVCYLEPARWTSAGLNATVLHAVAFWFLY